MSQAISEPLLRSRGRHNDVIYPNAVPFVLVHLACFAAIYTGVSKRALILAAALYVIRMFAITAGLHRYFSHRAFKTSRWFQFALAALAQSSAQGGVLWWASKHRVHHRHSDTELDVHSPARFGFFFAHIGWVYSASRGKADYANIRDLTKYPELVWLDNHIHLPVLMLIALAYAIGGWQGVVVGVLWSTVALYHATFAINSVAHVWGRQRYFTGDKSRNNAVLALFTLGEGWHNNHHYYMASARQGFFWWEFDPTYVVLRAMQAVGMVWDINEPDATVRRGERPLGRDRIRIAAEAVAMHLAATPECDRNQRHAEAIASRLVGRTRSLAQVVSLAMEQIHIMDGGEV